MVRFYFSDFNGAKRQLGCDERLNAKWTVELQIGSVDGRGWLGAEDWIEW
jgi:hypothetical protein